MASRKSYILVLAAMLLAICMATPALCFSCEPLLQGGELAIAYIESDPMKVMAFAADDRGSGARRDLTVFRPQHGYWFGHTAREGYGNLENPQRGYRIIYSGDIAASHSPIKAPVGWRRVWGLRRCSDRHAVYGMWCPIAPAGYKPLGCIFRRTGCGGHEADSHPPASEVAGFVTLRNDLCAPASSSGSVWTDRGSGARDDGSIFTLKANNHAGCGFDLQLMLAEAGYPHHGSASGFAVPDESKVRFIRQR